MSSQTQNPTKNNNAIIIWLITGCFLVFTMVVIGGITRLTGSGLSITEWNVITGSIPPLNDAQWQQEFAKYQASPQFQKINSHFDIHDFKSIYWWEFIHRLIGRVMGIAFLVPFIYFLIKKRISKELLPKLLFIFALGAWQGFLGWYMVKSGLVHQPYVSHIRLAIHLLNAFLTFGYIFWVALGLKYENYSVKNQASKSIKKWTIITFVLLIIQIAYGAFVAGLKAGHFYNTWPKMGDEWIASTVGEGFTRHGIVALFNDMSVVQFIHRTIALTVVTLIIVLWWQRNKVLWHLNAQQKNALSYSLFFVIIQLLLGIFTLLLAVPIWLGVVHQAGAFFIFAALIYQIHRLKYK